MSRKNIASVLAIFFGFIGAHKFYLNRFKTGVFYLLISWTSIPFFLTILVDLPIIRAIPNKAFNRVYSEEGYVLSDCEQALFSTDIIKTYLTLALIVFIVFFVIISLL